jgi:hypothetical protein
MLLAIGIGSIATPPGFILILIGNLVFILMLIRFEEAGLRRRYGAVFDTFCAQVPALLPRLIPAVSRSGVRPSLGQGLRAEIFTGAMALGMVAILIWQGRGLLVFFGLWISGWIVQTILVRSDRQAGTT